jgi:hypothetical protein
MLSGPKLPTTYAKTHLVWLPRANMSPFPFLKLIDVYAKVFPTAADLSSPRNVLTSRTFVASNFLTPERSSQRAKRQARLIGAHS